MVRDANTYVLNLCRNCEWEGVETILDQLIQAFQSESSPPGLLSASKQQLLATDRWGNNPLHLVCFHKPPPSVVTGILKAAEGAGVAVTMFDDQANTAFSCFVMRYEMLRRIPALRGRPIFESVPLELAPQSKDRKFLQFRIENHTISYFVRHQASDDRSRRTNWAEMEASRDRY